MELFKQTLGFLLLIIAVKLIKAVPDANKINLLYAHAMGKPLWLTEFGAAIQHLGSKEIIAQYLENCYRLFERLKDGNRRKVAVAFWFAWDDRTQWDPAR